MQPVVQYINGITWQYQILFKDQHVLETPYLPFEGIFMNDYISVNGTTLSIRVLEIKDVLRRCRMEGTPAVSKAAPFRVALYIVLVTGGVLYIRNPNYDEWTPSEINKAFADSFLKYDVVPQFERSEIGTGGEAQSVNVTIEVRPPDTIRMECPSGVFPNITENIFLLIEGVAFSVTDIADGPRVVEIKQLGTGFEPNITERRQMRTITAVTASRRLTPRDRILKLKLPPDVARQDDVQEILRNGRDKLKPAKLPNRSDIVERSASNTPMKLKPVAPPKPAPVDYSERVRRPILLDEDDDD